MTSNAANRNLWSVLYQRKENVLRSIESRLEEEAAFTSLAVQNNREFHTRAFQSQLELEKSFSKRQLKCLFNTLREFYSAPILIRLMSSDRHAILANKLFQLATLMANDVANIVRRPPPLAKKKVINKVTKKRKTPHTNTEDAAMLRRISEQQKRMATIAQLEEMGSTKAFAVEAVNRCGYNDVNTCLNYIFAKNTTAPLFSNSSVYSSNISNNNSNAQVINVGFTNTNGSSRSNDSPNNGSSSSNNNNNNVIECVTNQDELKEVCQIYEEQGYPKSEFILALREAGGVVKVAVALLEKQKAEEAQQIAASQKEQNELKMKKKEQKEMLKQKGEIIKSEFFKNSIILSGCPSFKNFIEVVPNVDERKSDFPLECFKIVAKLRVHIIELLKLEEQSFSWFKDGAKPFFEKHLSPKLEMGFKNYGEQSQSLLNTAFDQNVGREVNIYTFLYHPQVLEPINQLLEKEIMELKTGLFAMPAKGGLPPIFDDAIDKKEFTFDDDGIEFVQSVSKKIHEVSSSC